MRIGDLLFTYDGRINRAKFWLGTAIQLFAVALVLGIAFMLGERALGTALIFLAIPYLASTIMIGAKRLHDRGKSGWWLVPYYFVPGILELAADSADDNAIAWVLTAASIALTSWALLELGILKGNFGSNRYGPDPLDHTAIEEEQNATVESA